MGFKKTSWDLMGFVSPDFVGIHHQRGYQWIGFRERPQETIGLYTTKKKRLSCTMIQSWDLGAFGAPASGREIERVGTSELPKFRKWATKKKECQEVSLASWKPYVFPRK